MVYSLEDSQTCKGKKNIYADNTTGYFIINHARMLSNGRIFNLVSFQFLTLEKSPISEITICTAMTWNFHKHFKIWLVILEKKKTK